MFNSKANTVFLHFSIFKSFLFLYLFLSLSLFLPRRSLENFSMSTFHPTMMFFISHIFVGTVGSFNCTTAGVGDMPDILCSAWHKAVCQWKGA